VDHSATLAADLALLSGAIKNPGDGLEPLLESLVEDLRRAIGSYLGLTMTIAVDDHEISFTQSERADPAGTSLQIPLASVAGSPPGSTLVLYAAVPGAFVDLAADMSWILALEPSMLVLDKHLGVPVPSEAVIGLHEHAIINRAIGALIEKGFTPDSARAELRRHAEADSGDVPAAAQRLLDSLLRSSPPKPR